MVAGGPLLLLLGLVVRQARLLLQVLAALYVVGGLLMARRVAAKTGANAVLTFAAMATMHVTYGAGFLWGAWKERQRLAAERGE
jgi:uncharacterized membrane protein YphA (DoxX/SURF4 family)